MLQIEMCCENLRVSVNRRESGHVKTLGLQLPLMATSTTQQRFLHCPERAPLHWCDCRENDGQEEVLRLLIVYAQSVKAPYHQQSAVLDRAVHLCAQLERSSDQAVLR